MKTAAQDVSSLQGEILQNIAEGVLVTRISDALIVFASPRFETLFGYQKGELIGKNVSILDDPEGKSPAAQASEIQNCLKQTGVWQGEIRNRKKDGTTFCCRVRASTFDHSEYGKVWIGVYEDITESKKAEDALRLRESYLTAIIENQPGLVWLKDRDGKFLAVNNSFAKSCNLDDPKLLVGKTDFDIWPHELATKYVADDNSVIKSGEPCIVEERISDRGNISWFETFKTPLMDDRGMIIGTTGYSRNITKRKRMEEELQKAQKLESLGIFAGGIAHDFNNLLGGIFSYIDLARSVAKDERVKEYLEPTLEAMNRARALTLQLLTFAKGGEPVRKLTPLISFIREFTQFALSGSNVSCDFSLPENLWVCNIDKNQIGQVIDNIVINAKQAMPNGGTVKIAANNLSLGEKEHPLIAKGDYVKVSIKDSGIGIPKDIMPRIFDPFYTTKTKGHGLGLSTCYSIIKRHGGAIDVESEQGTGSTFHVYLPASPEIAPEEILSTYPHRGTGAIIVMDDEEVIRTSTRVMLEMMGYNVVCKNNGKAVLDFFVNETGAGHNFVGMLFDLTIPGGMGGKEAITEIRKLDKKVLVFVTSGYAEDPIMANPAEYGFTASICKPFIKEELENLLNKYLK